MPHIELDIDGLPLNRPVRMELGSSGIVVVRRDDGVSAFEDSCPHAQWRLSLGQIVDGVLECPGHGWEFDVATGRCVTVPAYCLRRCTVTLLDGRVRVELVAEPAGKLCDQVTA